MAGNPKSQLSTPSTEHYEWLVAQAVVPRPPRRQKKPHAIWNVEELGQVADGRTHQDSYAESPNHWPGPSVVDALAAAAFEPATSGL